MHGIVNCLDTDSDGDGCGDANEAYGSPNIDSNGDGTYGGVIGAAEVDGDGKVIGAAYNTGAVTAVTDSGDNTACLLDTDLDGVFDNADLDADNDGILDIDEKSACAFIEDPSFESPIASPSTGFDSFAADFPVTSKWKNSNGSADILLQPVNLLLPTLYQLLMGMVMLGFTPKGLLLMKYLGIH